MTVRERFLYLPVGISVDEVNTKGRVAYRPVLLASVSTLDSAPFKVPCLLDTGADCCILPGSIASSLGLELTSLPRGFVRGIGNEAFEVFYGVVTIDIGRGLNFEARVGFSGGSDKIGYGVLGQTGFFDQFHVEFRLADGFYTIEPATPSVIH